MRFIHMLKISSVLSQTFKVIVMSLILEIKAYTLNYDCVIK